jgi:hypothetical protein
MACAAWLFLFAILLIVPPPPGPRRGGGPDGGRDQQADGGAAGPVPEPPAVISLLAGRLDKLGFGATLVDLAARGWFQVRAPGEPVPGETSGRAESAGRV